MAIASPIHFIFANVFFQDIPASVFVFTAGLSPFYYMLTFRGGQQVLVKKETVLSFRGIFVEQELTLWNQKRAPT